VIFGTAGHIDHGKTALVRALTGVDTDRLPEERRRGISIDLGFAPLALDGLVASVVDVPGHDRFVDTMIAGASGIDAAVLVVAATEGVMPQTREHCEVLRALAVPVVTVVVTKIDRIPRDSIAARMDAIRAALVECDVRDAVPLLPFAAPGADGIDAVRAALADAARAIRPRDPNDLFRFVVDRAFTVRGTGTVVTGTVWSGSVAVGERVRVLPDDRAFRVRAIQAHGATAERAVAGARFALALADAAPADVVRGATLVTDDAWIPSTRIVVKLDAAPAHLDRRLSVHLGAMRASAHWNASSADRRVLRLAVERALVARSGDRMAIRVRQGDRVIIGAAVVDPLPERGTPVAADGAAEQLAALARAAGTRGVAGATLAVRLGIPPGDVPPVTAAAGVIRISDRLFDPGVVSEVATRGIALVERQAVDHPFLPPLGADELRSLLHVPAPLFDAALRRAEAVGRVACDDGRVRPTPDSLSPKAEAMLARVLRWVETTGLEGVTASEGIDAFGVGVEDILRHAERGGNLIRIGGVRYCDASVLAAAIVRLRAAMISGREFTPTELRGVFGVSRKYLIPLLEYCDATRVTIRRSGGRVLADVSSR
jgi:selenocysteine-specific elongation factor